MKRYTRALLVTVLSIGLMGSVSVGAEGPCAGATITNTGADSVNTIECVDASSVKVSCSNGIYVVSSSDQTAESGMADGPSAITGNATNDNNAVVTIGASCATQTTVPVTPTPPAEVAKTTPGTGLGAAAAKPKVAALPNTASNPIVDIALVATASLVAILIGSRLFVLAYKNAALK